MSGERGVGKERGDGWRRRMWVCKSVVEKGGQ